MLTSPYPNGRQTPPPDRLKLLIGVQETVALAYQDGKEVQSPRDGSVAVMYTLSDGRKAFFKPAEADALDALQLAPGEPFKVLQRNARSLVEFSRTGHPAEQKAAPVSPIGDTPASVPTTKLEHAMKTAIQAAANAERFAAEIGYTVRFDADMITRAALTVLINSEGGRK